MPAAPAMEARSLVVEGRPARVFSAGRGSDAFLLLHGGWGGAAMHWSAVWERLGASARVVAPDLPGIGDPSVPGRARLSDYARWLRALLDALEIERATVVGNSFGASLAWSFAGRVPERTRAVVLVDGMPMPRTPRILAALGRRRLGRGLMRALVRRLSFTPRALARAFADPSLAPSVLGAELGVTPRRRLDAFVDCLIAGDGPPAPRAPVLVVWGADDRLPGTSLADGRAIAAGIPGARFVVLERAGHFPQIERPEAFADVIEAFVARAAEEARRRAHDAE